ncbi:MAG: hypothetical protein L0027_14590, partial [Candidatus Rokubacteria bacterium]|nr:hypothetical protein [Candidatus Rokubacteria bacterium]
MVSREGDLPVGDAGEFRDAAAEAVPRGCRYRHPLGWYALSIPPGWKLAAEDEPVRILATHDEAAAVVSVAKLSGGPPPEASLDKVCRAVPGLTVLERRDGEEGEVRGMRFARVEEVVGQRPPWWKFWRRPRAEAHIFTACFTRGPLVAFVTFEVNPDRAERHRLAAGALIGSFDLAEN